MAIFIRILLHIFDQPQQHPIAVLGLTIASNLKAAHEIFIAISGMKLDPVSTCGNKIRNFRGRRKIATRTPEFQQLLSDQAARDIPRLIRLSGPRRAIQNDLLLDVKGLQGAYRVGLAIRVPARTQWFPVEVEVLSRQEFREFSPDSFQVIVDIIRRSPSMISLNASQMRPLWPSLAMRS